MSPAWLSLAGKTAVIGSIGVACVVLAAIAIPGGRFHRGPNNETSAIAACKMFAESEESYFARHHCYAMTLNDLYDEEEKRSSTILGFARAEGDATTAMPRDGYIFRVLTRQGSAAIGGEMSYMEGTQMTKGYGLSAIPLRYDVTGRNTFIINQSGTIYQKDKGPAGGHEIMFNPDSTWIPAM